MAPLTPTHSQCSLDSLFDPLFEDDLSLFLVTPQQKRKRVRINDRAQLLGYVEHVSEITQSERSQGWYSKAEYEATKFDAKNRCRELRRSVCFKECLTDAYDQACLAVGKTLNNDKIADLTHDITPQSGLLAWCRENESSRGLERWSSKVHGFVRGRSVGEAKHAVLLEQARQFLLNERDHESIARIAMEASRTSIAFARLLGEADAVAASGKRQILGDEDDYQPRKIRKISSGTISSDDESLDEPRSPPYIIEFSTT